MRGLICYYSGTGNTKLACEAIARKTEDIDFELFDITREGTPELADVSLIGFATWADFFNPPQRMKTFLESLPQQEGIPAFVFNTYGSISGRTLPSLDRWTSNRGFHVIAGHSLHTSENYPPLIKYGLTSKNSPSSRELTHFANFILHLDELARMMADGKAVPGYRCGLLRFMPALSRTHSRKSMGEKHVDADACTECGICRDRCPYGAITLDPKPVFDQSRCYGCWACYNHCPTQAIYTKKIRNIPQYAHPNDELKKKLLGQSYGGRL